MSNIEASIFNFDGISLSFPDYISISSDTFEKDDNAKYKVISLVEPDNVLLCFNSPYIVNYISSQDEFIEYISKNFDLVLTYKKHLLDRIPNSRYMNTTGSFLEPDHINISNKTNSISYLISGKQFTSGHLFRHKVFESLKNVQNINEFVYSQCMTPPRVIKSHYFNNQKFSIIIENEKSDFYITEKLIDCMLSKTIPIYWGCPSVSNYFNIEGIITFDNVEELHEILWNLKVEDYDKMYHAVEDNFYKAKLVPDYESALKKEINSFFYNTKE